jgi:hypothetical protein
LKKIFSICLLLFAQPVLCEEQKLLTIYHDPDYSNHRAYADAMQQYLNDDSALFMLGGLHSPLRNIDRQTETNIT